MEHRNVRTDLAVEARESITHLEGDLRGIRVEEYEEQVSEIRVTKVIIESKNAAKSMGKAMGTYITLEAPRLIEGDEDYHREVSVEIAKHMKQMIPNINTEQSLLIVGLGNQDVTADALGPRVIDNLFITRHMLREYGTSAYHQDKMHSISSIVPGVMAKTGMETAEIIKGVVEETKPNAIIVIDALAARSVRRLNRTIQITNTGIHPGSGVGNHRNALTKESLGVLVVAIGVPTVVDAATIVKEGNGEARNDFYNMYVTSKDIDETIKRLSFTISEAINMAFSEVS
ncbi:MAG: GPR endopeptidase [Eubacteriales bacterium]